MVGCRLFSLFGWSRSRNRWGRGRGEGYKIFKVKRLLTNGKRKKSKSVSERSGIKRRTVAPRTTEGGTPKKNDVSGSSTRGDKGGEKKRCEH